MASQLPPSHYPPGQTANSTPGSASEKERERDRERQRETERETERERQDSDCSESINVQHLVC